MPCRADIKEINKMNKKCFAEARLLILVAKNPAS